MPPDEPNEEEKLEELPQDITTPFQPADDETQFDDTEPRTDTDVEIQDLYDAGKSAASSGAAEPHDDPTVTGYDPPEPTKGSPS